ncbi:MAG: hypothetical protein H0W51_08100 [Euzebyales bacterium]|jgi:hypothetical protein|nr:hypothetical protein [Euzebyales bacterium]MDQ3343604.1 hypothetical protein [Actinomycetota bacterium]
MGRKSSTTTVQDKAAELAAQVKEAKLDQRAAELAERVRDSEAFQAAQARGSELAAVTREKVREAHLEERAAELAKGVRDSATVQAAAENAREVSDRALLRLGGWLSEGKTAERLHLQPAKRRFPGWLAMILGLGAGYLIGMLTSGKRDDLSSEFGSADAWTPPPPSPTPATDLSSSSTGAAATGGLEGGTGGIEPAAPPQSVAQKPLEDRVRTALGQDPRTADLPRLNVNVVEGTVFVRGSAPAGFDEAALRAVVADVEGVTDVDLQVSADA